MSMEEPTLTDVLMAINGAAKKLDAHDHMLAEIKDGLTEVRTRGWANSDKLTGIEKATARTAHSVEETKQIAGRTDDAVKRLGNDLASIKVDLEQTMGALADHTGSRRLHGQQED